MPSDDVSDLRDVVDAINKLCDTMKTSSYDEESFDSCSQTGSVDLVDLPLCVANEEILPEEIVLAEVEPDPDWYVACQIEPGEPDEVIFKKIEHYNTETWRQFVTRLETVSPERIVGKKVETHAAESWSEPFSVIPETVQRTEVQLERWSDPVVAAIPETIKKTEHTERYSDPAVAAPEAIQKTEVHAERWSDPSSRIDIASPEDMIQNQGSTERWSDSSVSLPGQLEEETVTSDGPAQVVSEMYYTASSEVSLLSDLETIDKGQEEEIDKDDRKECVIAGHVAAMRERFESMTRANTPCPDLVRSVSPTRDVFAVTPSPDRLG